MGINLSKTRAIELLQRSLSDRKNVRALVKGGVEMLSDYSGVVYIDLDDGEWKLELAKEMKAAGLAFDMNRLVESH